MLMIHGTPLFGMAHFRTFFGEHGTESWPFGIRRYESEELCEAAKGPYTHQVYGFYAMQTVEHMHLAIRCAIFGDG